MTKKTEQRIKKAFEQKAFIPYLSCGDPDIETTEKMIETLIESGAALIELGIPFSDPVAEGPVITNASVRALAGGVNIEKIFAMVKRLRAKYTTPFIMMTYANPVFAYGRDKFMSQCVESGVDGLIIPDAPYEEKDLFQDKCDEYGLTLISMVAPSSQDRIKMITEDAEGFIYVVSSLGVTGVRSEIETDVSSIVNLIKETRDDIPCAIGFGISTPDQARQMAEVADGVIIGSAIVRQIGENQASPEKIGDYAKSIVQAIE